MYPIPHKDTRGFSLVELLVSLAVIAILGAITIVALSQTRQSADSVTCASNLRSIATAVVLHTNENGGNLPSPLGTASNGWESLIAPYMGHETTDVPIPELRCPKDPKPLDDGNGNFARSYVFSGLIGRSLAQPYGMVAFSIPTSESPAAPRVRNMTQLVTPSESIMIFERMTGMSAPYNTLPAYQFSSSWSFANGWFSGEGPRFPDGSCYHGSTMNFAFADGHVEALEPAETYYPKNLWQATEWRE